MKRFPCAHKGKRVSSRGNKTTNPRHIVLEGTLLTRKTNMSQTHHIGNPNMIPSHPIEDLNKN